MNTKDLEIFNEMPINFWIKDGNGRYLWANRTVTQLAGENVVGKTDRELVWGDNAEAFRASDRRVFETGKLVQFREPAGKSSRGPVMLAGCKWLGELDGKKQSFGIGFIVE